MALLARLIYNEAANLNYDIDTNGERALIAKVCSDGDFVFDVGANQGSWTKVLLDLFPNVTAHCFELIPHTAQRLKKELDGQSAIITPCGLGAEEGCITANYCAEHSELSGIYDVHSNYTKEPIKCRLAQGDTYGHMHRIDRIRLLKVDCEGSEYDVLKGFDFMLRKKRIDVLQFEYGKANITAKTTLLDFYHLLTPLGYTIDKLYPDGVDFRPYALEDEDFTGPNYVACTSKDPQLVSRLQRFPASPAG